MGCAKERRPNHKASRCVVCPRPFPPIAPPSFYSPGALALIFASRPFAATIMRKSADGSNPRHMWHEMNTVARGRMLALGHGAQLPLLAPSLPVPPTAEHIGSVDLLGKRKRWSCDPQPLAVDAPPSLQEVHAVPRNGSIEDDVQQACHALSFLLPASPPAPPSLSSSFKPPSRPPFKRQRTESDADAPTPTCTAPVPTGADRCLCER